MRQYTFLRTHILTLKGLFLLLFIYSCIGCTESNEYIHIKGAVNFNESSFSHSQELSHSIYNNDFIGNPVRLTRIDTLLFAVDSKTDTIVHVFSTHTPNLTYDIIPRGIGPNELLSIESIRTGRYSNSLCAYDINQKLWVEGAIDTINLKYKFTHSFHFKGNIFDTYLIEAPIWLDNHSFACISLTNYKERYFIFNQQNELVETGYNPNITFDENIPNGILCEMSSSLMNLRPDKAKLVLAGRFLDYIEIYDLN